MLKGVKAYLQNVTVRGKGKAHDAVNLCFDPFSRAQIMLGAAPLGREKPPGGGSGLMRSGLACREGVFSIAQLFRRTLMLYSPF